MQTFTSMFQKPNIKQCRKAFSAIDINQVGTIKLTDLEFVLQQLQMQIRLDQLQPVLKYFQTKNTISFDSFCHLVYFLLNSSTSLNKNLFLLADKQFHEQISNKQLLDFYQINGVELNEDQHQKICQQVSNEHGFICFDEFVKMINQCSE